MRVSGVSTDGDGVELVPSGNEPSPKEED